jgi:phosphonoacetate hydrolase
MVPAVLLCLDGMGPDYVEAALGSGLWPRVAASLRGGAHFQLADAILPTFTNPNNLSLVTGLPACGHGICGNHFFDRAAGREVPLEDPSQLRAETRLFALERAGARVASVCAKEKLRRLLGAGRTGPSFSSERAAEQGFAPWGIERLDRFVGRPAPAIYSAEASIFVLEAGVEILRRCAPDFLYLSTTDYLQHRHAPGAPELRPFLEAVDRAIGAILDFGAALAVTADHAMSAKPRIVWLGEALPGARVTLPITDPYVRHHGALGGCAYVSTEDPDGAIEILRGIPGIEEASSRAEAAARHRLPADRIGDVVVFAAADTALGKTPAEHDLAALEGPLRSHGGPAERRVPLFASAPPRREIRESREALDALIEIAGGLLPPASEARK